MTTDIINWNIFSEIISMDEDEPGFSKSLIRTFIDQATQIFSEIDGILAKPQIDEQDLAKLSGLGHYLKGSAASLGLFKIQEQCEKIQNYGLKKDFDGVLINNGISWEQAIKLSLNNARVEFEIARKFLSDYYKEQL